MIDFLVILATFAVIFPAELPDKSMFAAVALGTRFNPLAVWIGLAAAFLLHVIIAVSAGHIVTLLPDRLVAGVVTALFAAGALYMFFSKEEAPDESDEALLRAKTAGTTSAPKVSATAFGVVFVSEWGDLTQLATINLAARYEDPLSVAIGSTSALWLISGLGVLLGARLVRAVSMTLMRRISGTVLLGLAIWSLVDFLKT
jgi:Ca2+/H+ antiporter, TMEM165/GDT1 family